MDDTQASGDRPLSPEAMLALAGDQGKAVTSRLAGFVPWIVLSWALAWLFGFGALWLVDGLAPDFSLSLPVGVTIFVVLLAAAVAISMILGFRSSRGLRGNSGEAFAGIVYGCTWTVGSFAIVGFAQGLFANGMDPDLANIFYPAAFVQFAGLMYILGAALWKAVPMLICGLWTLVVGVAAPFFGYPTHYLFLALAGGGGFLALAVAAFVYLRRVSGRVERAVRRG